jgi:hypothetical protein
MDYVKWNVITWIGGVLKGFFATLYHDQVLDLNFCITLPPALKPELVR